MRGRGSLSSVPILPLPLVEVRPMFEKDRDRPAFLFYVRNWLSSTKGMAPDLKGHYIDLLCWAWDNGPLPDDPAWRARMFGVTVAEADRVWSGLREKWKAPTETCPGWINERLEAQRKLLIEATERGSFAARERWRNRN